MFVSKANPPLVTKNAVSGMKTNSSYLARQEALKNFIRNERLEYAGTYVYFVKSDDNCNALVASRIGGPTRPVNPLVLKKA